jgi:hypothetical protein
MILACLLAFSSFFTTSNFKTKNLNKYKVSKFDHVNKKNLNLGWLKYVN